ncbi:hypothetical protein PR048_024614 [Dryococelus australis]|uniref:Cytochrome b5 heme-binding domain-containing protein n=1 Tax=Dryococelus australis TaxID=614101 RepID=A0ABQ9GP15_9NEOP|nr:hypothetical protein PR048_024614 [Dryococelus australis]
MAEESESSSFVVSLISGIVSSPLKIFLSVVIAFIVYKFFNTKQRKYEPIELPPDLPKMRRDFTLQELKPYDGTGPDGRVLMAVNGKVYDVTRGKRFYGPGKAGLTTID